MTRQQVQLTYFTLVEIWCWSAEWSAQSQLYKHCYVMQQYYYIGKYFVKVLKQQKFQFTSINAAWDFAGPVYRVPNSQDFVLPEVDVNTTVSGSPEWDAPATKLRRVLNIILTCYYIYRQICLQIRVGLCLVYALFFDNTTHPDLLQSNRIEIRSRQSFHNLHVILKLL